MKLLRVGSNTYKKLCNRGFLGSRRIQIKVARILDAVKREGDDAVTRFTKKFDGVSMKARECRVSENEIVAAYREINSEFVSCLKEIFENIERFYKKNLPRARKVKVDMGAVLKEAVIPIEKVGVYVPAGTAPLISTVYMTVIPARVAGVKEIIICSPPDKEGRINPFVVVVANLLKVNAIYKIGGAQAIGAMAFGTKTVPKVDKIVGPGNQFVSEAKRQVYGFCDVDMIAGPSEVVVIANKFSNQEYVMKDLEAQAEHNKGLSILITTSRPLAKLARKNIASGYVMLVQTMEEAVKIANEIAPEHLHVMVTKSSSIVKNIRNAGAIFIGPYSPVAVGDYSAGPSHVLPTGGSARFFSGLGIEDFLKRTHIVSLTKKYFEKLKTPTLKIAEVEGLKKHAESIEVRFK
jgi:histidinol dehydrogenase